MITASQYTASIQVLEFQRTVSLETATSMTMTITSHGIDTGSFVVNETRRATTQLSSERGSRKVTVVDPNTITVSPVIANQTASDTVALFKYVDRTEYLKDGSLSISLGSEGQNEASFSLIENYKGTSSGSTTASITGSESKVLIYTNETNPPSTYKYKRLTYFNGYWYAAGYLDNVYQTVIYKSSDFTTWVDTNFSNVALDYTYPQVYAGSNNLYVLTGCYTSSSAKYLHIYNGSSWSTVALPNLPTASTNYTDAFLCVDSDENVHVVCNVTSTTAAYKKYYHTVYNGSSWSDWDGINSQTYDRLYLNGACIDSNDVIHVVASYRTSSGSAYRTTYCNGTTGAWSTWEDISSYVVYPYFNNIDVICTNDNKINILVSNSDELSITSGSSGSWTSASIESSSGNYYQYGSICNNGSKLHVVVNENKNYPTSSDLLYFTNESGSWVKKSFTDRDDYFQYPWIYHNGTSIGVIVSDYDAHASMYGYFASGVELISYALDYKVSPGQYIKILLNGIKRFAGIISNTDSKKMQDGISRIVQSVQCVGFNSIPARRTIRVNYSEDTTCSTIVGDMVSDYLSQDGIEAGEISSGVNIGDEWKNDVISVAEVLDECASKSGFQWFIDNDMKLNFYQDATTVSWHSVSISNSTTSTFSDFRDVSVNETVDNYANKVFVLGGNDDHGDQIYTINGDLAKQNEMQMICAGTGVYGMIHRDTEITEHDYLTAGPLTDADTVNSALHPMTNGDYFWNVSRNIHSFVTDGSDPDLFECESVASQASGDTIEVYVEANKVGRNILKRQSKIPQIITFKSFTADFYPQTKLTVSISDMSVSGIFCIEEVSISEIESCYFDVTVKAILRAEDNFSTQKSPGYVEFFRGF